MVTGFEGGWYSHPLLESAITRKVVLAVFLFSDAVTVHVPCALVVQLVAPVPADHVPVTATFETGDAPSVTAIVTLAVHPFRELAVVEERPPTHIGVGSGGGGAVTVTDPEADAVAPSSSVTVSDTGYVPAPVYVRFGFASGDPVPSPKDHWRPTMAPSASVDVSVNEQVSPMQLLVNDAEGAAFCGGGVVVHV